MVQIKSLDSERHTVDFRRGDLKSHACLSDIKRRESLITYERESSDSFGGPDLGETIWDALVKCWVSLKHDKSLGIAFERNSPVTGL